MQNLQNLDLLSVGIAIASTAILGFVIFFNNRKSQTSKLFLLFSAATIVWSLFHYLSYQSNNSVMTLWLLRLEIFCAVWLVYTQYLLIYVFPKESFVFSSRFKRLALIPLAVSILNLTPLVFKHVAEFSADGIVEKVTNGPGIAVFGITVLSFVIAGIVTLIKKIRATKDATEKKQFKAVLYGIALMFSLLIIFNFIFPAFLSNTTFVRMGAVFVLPFVFFTGYAIFRHGLLNVKIISTEILVLFLAIALLFQLLTSTNYVSLFLTFSIFLLVLSVGMLLIRSVLKEVQQREELQRLSGELAKANEQLKELDQAKSEFLSVASHQLRTPLTAIKGYVSMILEGDYGPVSEQQKPTLQMVFDSAQRLAVLVSDLLDLSRIESGRMEFDFVAVNLCEVIDSVIAELAPKSKAKGLYLYFDDVNKSCPDIRADSEKIRQVIINLIDNAVKYTVHGGVIARLIKHGDKLEFTVADTGIGVDPAEKDKLFEKFFRTTAANELTREGTGLGIYVVKKIVEAHGGTIGFDSAGVDKGTTFKVVLPLPAGPIKEERVKIDSLEAF